MLEWPNWLFFLVRLLVAASAVGLFFGYGWWATQGHFMLSLALSMLSVPVVGMAMAKPVVLLASEGIGWLWAQPLSEFQGNYYAFNDVQVRVYEVDGQLWLIVSDVLKAIGMKAIPDSFLAVYPDHTRGLGTTRATAMTPAGLEKLLGKRIDSEAVRFLNWMRREVVKPWERKKERGL